MNPVRNSTKYKLSTDVMNVKISNGVKKRFPHIFAFVLIFVLIFAVSGFLFPETVGAQQPSGQGDSSGFWAGMVRTFVALTVGMVLKFVGLLTGLAGVVLNGVIYYTVVEISNNYADIPAINAGWRTIRDVANMGFIFILLYAAIKTILGMGSETKKLVVSVIIVAILINFSLFFTRLVIDASNVLALMFYDAIVPSGFVTSGNVLTQPGLSDAFMEQLDLQSLYKAANGDITVGSIITIGLMGSIMLIIAAFVFFAAAIMFIIRYAILIFLLILSPIAFMAFVLPALKPYGDKWKDALIGQAFFAPIYFMLIWITLSVLAGVMDSFGGVAGNTATSLGDLALTDQGVSVSSGAFSMFMNFMVIIVFLIASLVITKQWADKAGPSVTKATKWMTGAAVGGMAFAGRQTVGRAGQAVADSRWLKDHPESRAARLALAAGRKTGSAGFDARQAPLGVGKILDADSKVLSKGSKGGYNASREATIKKRMAFEEGLKQETTGADVERAMERMGWGKTDNRRLRATAGQVEQVRLDTQKRLDKKSAAITKIRQDRYRHSLSQTRFSNLNLYSGVSTDAEAARRLRKGLKAKSEKDKLFDDLNDYIQNNPTTTPPPATPPGETTP